MGQNYSSLEVVWGTRGEFTSRLFLDMTVSLDYSRNPGTQIGYNERSNIQIQPIFDVACREDISFWPDNYCDLWADGPVGPTAQWNSTWHEGNYLNNDADYYMQLDHGAWVAVWPRTGDWELDNIGLESARFHCEGSACIFPS